MHMHDEPPVSVILHFSYKERYKYSAGAAFSFRFPNKIRGEAADCKRHFAMLPQAVDGIVHERIETVFSQLGRCVYSQSIASDRAEHDIFAPIAE